MANSYAVQTELSISSEAIAQALANDMGKTDQPDIKGGERPHLAPHMPDLAKVNSSSEMHIAGIAELEQKIDELEQQACDMVKSLSALKKRVRVIKHVVDERLADCQRQIAQLKDQMRYESKPIEPLTITSTCDHDDVFGGTT
jgi:predicted RNase H-like nuclease (RuvC/YqgF family)